MFFLQSTFDINILLELMKQGPLICGLVFAILYFYRRQQQVDANLKEANEKLEKYIREDSNKMLTVIDNNTRTMQELENYLIRHRP